VKDLERLKQLAARVEANGIEGDVIGLDDPYGSLITDISSADFQKLGYLLGDTATLQIDKKSYTMPYVKTFGDVAIGSPLLYVDSRGRMSLALNQRDFSKAYNVSPPVSIFIPRKGAK
jgi:S-adenosylmethionine hydrolase